jgi:hypothetical protein
VFCEISLQNPHLLLFDEPTNAADMEMIDSMVHFKYSKVKFYIYSNLCFVCALGGGNKELQCRSGRYLARFQIVAASGGGDLGN